MMPTTREPEPSPTTSLAPRSASQQPLDVQPPRATSVEEEDFTDEDNYDLYEDLPATDYGKHSHISLEDLEEDVHPEASAGPVSHSTIEGIVYQLFLCIFLCFHADILPFLMSSSGIDVTIEGEIGRATSESDVSISQGFSAGFPSLTPTTEVGEGSGMDFLLLCWFIILLSF
jgi:hypothetical protein